jgi:hypothetical protein
MVQIGTEPERVRRQFLSGNVFPAFGLRPAAGRLLMPDDDRVPGGHPVAVISYDFWVRRFGGDPAIVGKPVRIGGEPYEIVGVGPKGFTGTEPGIVTDIFLPAMMNKEAIKRPDGLGSAPGRPARRFSRAGAQVLHAQFASERRGPSRTTTGHAQTGDRQDPAGTVDPLPAANGAQPPASTGSR